MLATNNEFDITNALYIMECIPQVYEQMTDKDLHAFVVCLFYSIVLMNVESTSSSLFNLHGQQDEKSHSLLVQCYCRGCTYIHCFSRKSSLYLL